MSPGSAGTLYTSQGPKNHVFVVVFLKSNHEKLIPFVIASNLFPACVTACQQITASVQNGSKPTICNYCIHWESRQWTHEDWPGLCCRWPMLIDHKSKWPSAARSKLEHYWILKCHLRIVPDDLNKFLSLWKWRILCRYTLKCWTRPINVFLSPQSFVMQ